jgi:hypothetical protein
VAIELTRMVETTGWRFGPTDFIIDVFGYYP